MRCCPSAPESSRRTRMRSPACWRGARDRCGWNAMDGASTAIPARPARRRACRCPRRAGGRRAVPERSGVSVRRAAGEGPGRRAGLSGVRCASRRSERHARAASQADRASADAANRHRGGRTRHLRGSDAAHVAGRAGAPSEYGANAGVAVFQGRDGADVPGAQEMVGAATRGEADGGGRSGPHRGHGRRLRGHGAPVARLSPVASD